MARFQMLRLAESPAAAWHRDWRHGLIPADGPTLSTCQSVVIMMVRAASSHCHGAASTVTAGPAGGQPESRCHGTVPAGGPVSQAQARHWHPGRAVAPAVIMTHDGPGVSVGPPARAVAIQCHRIFPYGPGARAAAAAAVTVAGCL